MSATEIEDTGVPLPRISEIRALPDFRISVAWAKGSRTGRAETVDLSPVINAYKLYRPLRNDKELFQTARLVDDGNVVAWGDGSIDMSAELIEDIAEEAMAPEAFVKFLERNKLTQEAAAALLGYSRRQIGHYATTGPIPRVVALACYGYEARTGADEKPQLLNEAMHKVYEQASEDARAMLSQTTRRVAEVRDELKQMSADMRRELDATRAELKKGIFEWPEELSFAARQMRHVIVDQIEALAELNRIIARHGRGLDIIEPTARAIEPAEPPPSRVAASAAQAPSLTGGGARTGWLSELLTRAPHDAEPVVRTPGAPREPVPPREPPASREHSPASERSSTGHRIDALNSLAVDIARMIDHEAAADLWDRYKRGERNVFTRKLYTMQGQKAFEEIRRKYRSDRDYMRTVDRYIGEFERLLEEVSRDDRGQVVARTYLTSETGKVYTMLAHAAGRFD